MQLMFVHPASHLFSTGFHFHLILQTVAMKGQLNASKIFSSMSVFDLLRDQLHIIFQIIMDSMSAKVSLNRMNDFLHDVRDPLICTQTRGLHDCID